MIAGGRPRRTPGLRREEVAALAAVSIDYYIRLEQGRERSPSDQVIVALARALCLDAEAADYLYKLARPGLRPPEPVGWPEKVSPLIARIMRSWDHTPAYVLGRRLDVLASNPLFAALYQDLVTANNCMKLLFFRAEAHDFYRDWEKTALGKTAYLRAALAADPDDPVLCRFVDEIAEHSEDFRRLWACHDMIRPDEYQSLCHRDLGELSLAVQGFTVHGDSGQQLFVMTAAPGSPSERKLSLLSSSAHGTRPEPLPELSSSL